MTRTFTTIGCLIVFSMLGGTAAAVPVQADRGAVVEIRP